MSKVELRSILERAAWDDRFIAQLTDDFKSAVRDYDLTPDESAMLQSGDVRAIEAELGVLDPPLRRWLDCRLQQDSYAGDGFEDRLSRILASAPSGRGALIPILQRVQNEFGYVPEQVMPRIAAFLNLPESRVYGVATFYAQFRFAPIGRNHVVVCRGTGCHVRGAPRILDEFKRLLGIGEGQTTHDCRFSLETVACIGACGLSPCVTVNKTVETKMTPKKVGEVVKRIGLR